MQIGLIGGIGPAATDFYYRNLITRFASKDADLNMTIVHADAPTLVKNLMDDNKDAQNIGKHAFFAPSKCISPVSLVGPLTLNFSTLLRCTS